MARRTRKQLQTKKSSGGSATDQQPTRVAASARSKPASKPASKAASKAVPISDYVMLQNEFTTLLRSLKASATADAVEKQISALFLRWNGEALSFQDFLLGGDLMNFDNDLNKVSLADGLGNCVIDDKDAGQGHGTKQWTDNCLLGILRGMLSSKKFEFRSLDFDAFTMWANCGFSIAVENLLFVVLLVSGKCADYVELLGNLGEMYGCEPDDENNVESIEVWRGILKDIQSGWTNKWLKSTPVVRVNPDSILMRAAGHLNQDEVSLDLLEAVTNANEEVEGLECMWPESKKDIADYCKIVGLTTDAKNALMSQDCSNGKCKPNSNPDYIYQEMLKERVKKELKSRGLKVSDYIYQEMTKERLKFELKSRGLKVSGNKSELIKRLEEFESSFDDGTNSKSIGAAQFYVNNNEQTNDELKDECEKRGLPKSGNKKQLLGRLRKYEKNLPAKGKGKRSRDEYFSDSDSSSSESSSSSSESVKRHKRGSVRFDPDPEIPVYELKHILKERGIKGYTNMNHATLISVANALGYNKYNHDWDYQANC